jgi:hypothetical protein
MSSTFFTPLIILVLFNLSSYFYTKLDELTLGKGQKEKVKGM